MMGSGTTLVECTLLGRRRIGVDINPDAVMVARNRLDFSYAPLDADHVAPEIKTYAGGYALIFSWEAARNMREKVEKLLQEIFVDNAITNLFAGIRRKELI